MDKLFEWSFASRNLFRNKRRTFATVSAIVIGFVGLALLGGYILRTERYLKVNTIYINHNGHFSIYVPEGVDKFYVNPKKYVINNNLLDEIQNVLNEETFANQIEFSAKYLSGIGLISNGVTSVPFIAKAPETKATEFVSIHSEVQKWTKELSMNAQGVNFADVIDNNPDSISITKELGHLIGLSGDLKDIPNEKKEVLLAGRTIYNDLNAINAYVSLNHTTGLSLSEHTGVIAPFELLESLYSIEGASHVAVYLNNEVSLKKIMKNLKNRFEEKNINVELIPFNDERVGQFYIGTLDFLYIMGFFFIFLICSAVAISIINALTMGIIERTKEVGTLRSIGLSKKIIVNIFIKEAVLMTFIGVLIGTLLSQIVSYFINISNIYFEPPGIAGSMKFILNPDLWLCCLFAMLLLLTTIISAKWVSSRKVDLDIITLLTDEER